MMKPRVSAQRGHCFVILIACPCSWWANCAFLGRWEPLQTGPGVLGSWALWPLEVSSFWHNVFLHLVCSPRSPASFSQEMFRDYNLGIRGIHQAEWLLFLVRFQWKELFFLVRRRKIKYAFVFLIQNLFNIRRQAPFEYLCFPSV